MGYSSLRLNFEAKGAPCPCATLDGPARTACLAILDNPDSIGPPSGMEPLPFTELEAFLAVARHRSFSGAARELGISRSAVSQSIRQLEELVRVVLLTRTKAKGVGLAYTLEQMVREQLQNGALKIVLERYVPTVPGFYLYFPSVARKSAPLRLLIEAAKELVARAV